MEMPLTLFIAMATPPTAFATPPTVFATPPTVFAMPPMAFATPPMAFTMSQYDPVIFATPMKDGIENYAGSILILFVIIQN